LYFKLEHAHFKNQLIVILHTSFGLDVHLLQIKCNVVRQITLRNGKQESEIICSCILNIDNNEKFFK
jgi:hypothetical protein